MRYREAIEILSPIATQHGIALIIPAPGSGLAPRHGRLHPPETGTDQSDQQRHQI